MRSGSLPISDSSGVSVRTCSECAVTPRIELRRVLVQGGVFDRGAVGDAGEVPVVLDDREPRPALVAQEVLVVGPLDRQAGGDGDGLGIHDVAGGDAVQAVGEAALGDRGARRAAEHPAQDDPPQAAALVALPPRKT